MLVSSVTPPNYLIERTPPGFSLAEEAMVAGGKSVLFEVEEVFGSLPHVRFLEDNGGLRQEGGSYMHDVYVYWLERK
jgi:hypothetical protein